MKKLAIISMLLLSMVSFSQKWDAEDYYNNGYWSEAEEALKTELNKAGSNGQSMLELRLAMVNYYLKDFREAYDFFVKVSGDYKDFDHETKVAYFNVLRVMGEYQLAGQILHDVYGSVDLEDSFINFPQSNPVTDSKYELSLLDVEFGNSFMGMSIVNDSVVFSLPENQAEGRTNSYGLYFVSKEKWVNSGVLDIEKSIGFDDKVIFRATPAIMGQSTLLYSRNISSSKVYKENRASKLGFDASNVNYLNIYEYDFTEGVEVKSTLNQLNSNTTTPFYFKSRKVVIFSSDRVGGKGGYDIYYAHRTDSGWSDPINLESVNTEFDEVYPYVSGDVLYFSSKGHENYGGLDVLFATLEVNGQSIDAQKVKNIGSPINSSFDDFSFAFDFGIESGYLVSNRNTLNGSDQIFRVTKILDEIEEDTISSRVIDGVTKKGIPNVTIELFEINENKRTLESSIVTDNEGRWEFIAKRNKNYEVEIKAINYETKQILVPSIEKKTNRQSIIESLVVVELQPDLVSSTIKFSPIYFDFNSYELKEDEKTSLDSLVNFLDNNVGQVALLKAFTDAVGSKEYNKRLSDKRAQACLDYMLIKGVTSSQVKVKGLGEDNILNNCITPNSCSEQENRINRRVEISIL